jgi:hypothetical protein
VSERVFGQAYIYSCPGDQHQAALDVLDGHGLRLEYANEPEGQLGPDTRYMDQEVPVGTSNDLTKALIEKAPGASFVVWEDPSTEGLGGLHAYTPALGHFGGEYGADCTRDGQVVFADIMAAIASEDARANGIDQAPGQAMGRPWLDDWEHARAAARGVTGGPGRAERR